MVYSTHGITLTYSTTDHIIFYGQPKLCNNMNELEYSELSRTDVTAVKLLKNYILVGIGCYVQIFDRRSLQLKKRLTGQLASKIHGFIPSDNEEKIIVFGGKDFNILHLGVEIETLSRASTLCDDWLHSAVWFEYNKIAVLTAHNVVQIWKEWGEEPISTFKSKYNSILYSGLLLPYWGDLLMLSGTVYKEVIIQINGEEEALHILKGHKGAIFSISYDYESQLLITTSDDRSVRIWGPKNQIEETNNTIKYWKHVTLECKYELYGHSARVMRNTFTRHYILSVGEDGAICFWDKTGVMVSKRTAHQGGSIWSIDADETNIITGGGDGGVTLHPLTALHHKPDEVLITNVGTPKHLFVTARQNLVILNDNSGLIQYDIKNHTEILRLTLKLESTFQLMCLSSCKQIIAIIDMLGNLNVFMEPCKDEPTLVNILHTKLNVVNKVLSMHWINNRYLVICTGNGKIQVIGTRDNAIDVCDEFALPHCKERWLTAASADESRSIYVFGDRCGHIHVYTTGHKDPIKTFHKIHGNYGPTTITVNNNKIVSTGRNAAIQYFSINEGKVKLMHKKDVKFQWVEKFLDRNETLVCGFQERDFVVADIADDLKLIEVTCGGGHRPWDAIRYHHVLSEQVTEMVTLCYVKNSTVHINTYELNRMKPKVIIPGSHVKKINCAKALSVNNEIFIISGGEDTTLRISTLKNNELKDIFIFKHLSSVKTIKTHEIDKCKHLLVSAGGRAQICIRIIQFNTNETNEISVYVEDVIDHMIRGKDKSRACNQNWRTHTIDFDPETRIMDLEIFNFENDNNYLLTIACSDAVLRIYKLNVNEKKHTFEMFNEIKYHDTCILKTCKFQHHTGDVSRTLLCMGTTRGELSVWNAKDFLLDKDTFKANLKLHTPTTSGINSITTYNWENKENYIITAGDDGKVSKIELIYDGDDKLSCGAWHSGQGMVHAAQNTGLLYCEGNIITASLDQRITVAVPTCRYLGYVTQIYTDIPDVSGIELLDCDRTNKKLKILVFGKGFEVININVIYIHSLSDQIRKHHPFTPVAVAMMGY